MRDPQEASEVIKNGKLAVILRAEIQHLFNCDIDQLLDVLVSRGLARATFLLMHKVPARIVMEILGHSQISLTLNTYQHALPTMLGEAATAMDAVLAG